MKTIEEMVVGGEATRLDAPNDKAWQEQDQQNAQIEKHAQVLLESSGSPERAIQAIESLSELKIQSAPVGGAASVDPDMGTLNINHARASQFAKECGYETLDELIQTSEVLLIDGQVTWYLVSLGENDWRVWNTQSLTTEQVFTSREEAVQAFSISDLEAT
ncbi:MAG: hypothetical protein SFX18_02385 [Pirellulales bacterium]|nr:hypothetical protein [Pirellulales bacterium]